MCRVFLVAGRYIPLAARQRDSRALLSTRKAQPQLMLDSHGRKDLEVGDVNASDGQLDGHWCTRILRGGRRDVRHGSDCGLWTTDPLAATKADTQVSGLVGGRRTRPRNRTDSRCRIPEMD